MSQKTLLICEGKRCKIKSKNLTPNLIESFSSAQLEIRQVQCLDMCDYAQSACIKSHKNTYLRNVQKYSPEQWSELIENIVEEKEIKNLDFVKTI